MSNGETPGIGEPGLAKLHSHAPKAWRNLMKAVTVNAPKDLTAAQKSRARLARL